MESATDRARQVEGLRQRMTRWAGRRKTSPVGIATGCPSLDRLLPDGGFRAGTLVEWISDEGAGAVSLALAAAGRACAGGGTLLVIDRQRQFYPPAAVRAGIDPKRLILVYPPSAKDETWAIDQALRCPAIAAVLAWVERIDDKTFRRWQLAAEEGGGLGLLIRPPAALGEPSWADVRLQVSPRASNSLGGQGGQSHFRAAASQADPKTGTVSGSEPPGLQRTLQIVVMRCRGGADGRSVEVEVSDDADHGPLAPQLAHSTTRRRYVS